MSSPLKRSHVLERHRRLQIHIIYIDHVSFVRFNVRHWHQAGIFSYHLLLFSTTYFSFAHFHVIPFIRSSLRRSAPAGHLLFHVAINFFASSQKIITLMMMKNYMHNAHGYISLHVAYGNIEKCNAISATKPSSDTHSITRI